jgi:hypothetical protein
MRDSHGCYRGKGTEAIDQGSIKGGHVSITCCPWLGRLHEPRLKGNASERNLCEYEVETCTYLPMVEFYFKL